MFHYEHFHNFEDFSPTVLFLFLKKWCERNFLGQILSFPSSNKFQGRDLKKRIEKLTYTAASYFPAQCNFHCLLSKNMLLFQRTLAGAHFFHSGKGNSFLYKYVGKIFVAYTLSKAYKSFRACFYRLTFCRVKMDLNFL